ncbi:centromere kinetochore protein [Ophiostoma piceae UAMH 11346]|uniref:Centromere kinetochore protein n=1 Tax=Ophiostoma piceae (strain UAMH 11346) TaxID=1262450 RepID=S3CQL4_OPHP1|nr:centromere kinetochore protein [Ophiostoma piceae UAMH 11346]
MATATAHAPTEAISQALVDFSVRGLFPADDATSTAALTPETLPGAIAALAGEKDRLEAEIHNIVESSADDVRSWIDNAQALQVDIARRKTLATDIVIRGDEVQAQTQPSDNTESISSERPHTTADEAEAEARAQFLTNELNYNLQVRYLLEAIQRVGQLLDQVERAGRERRILESLRLLENAWTALDQMPVSKSCRAMRLLDLRAFELKTDVHAVFDEVWAALVAVDADKHSLTISQARDDEPMSLADAVVGFKAYKEVDSRMAALWHALDAAVVGPRMDLSKAARPALYVAGNTLGLKGTADDGVDALFHDLEQLFSFLSANLPADLVQSISAASPSTSPSSSISSSPAPTMMSDIVGRIVDTWLVTAVPTSLDQMAAFENMLEAAQAFCTRLTDLKFSGLGRLQEWIENAPRVWLAKRREAALDQVRSSVSTGLGTPQQVEKIEKQMVSRSEGKELAAAATTTTEQPDWDTAWSDGEGDGSAKGPAESNTTGDDGADEWGAWGDDDNTGASGEKEEETKSGADEAQPEVSADDDDGAADAWGWGEDDGGDAAEPEETPTSAPKPPSPRKTKKAVTQTSAPALAEPQTRELVLKEKYYISSLPAPVLGLITQVLEDALALTSGDHSGSSVATAAAGLFGVPALVLAMFRAVSPHFYALDVGGSMYLYNDAMYLAEKLTELVAAWTERLAQAGSSTAPVARLGTEVTKLQGFASRAYGKEMAVQKTVLRDLLGGDDNVLQGSSGNNRYSRPGHDQDEDADDYVDAAVVRVRSMAAAWQDVLAPSAWSQAVGSLADAVAHKLILDVLDMPSISQDEAFSLAKLIQKVTELDDLFLSPDDGSGAPRIPMTSQYAPNWLRLQYLSEVLQSNLREVRYLWMESELSLYFTVGEVLDLIKLSFEDNARSREVAKEIAANPRPAHL